MCGAARIGIFSKSRVYGVSTCFSRSHNPNLFYQLNTMLYPERYLVFPLIITDIIPLHSKI